MKKSDSGTNVAAPTTIELPTQYLTVAQAAHLLAVSESSIRRWIRTGELPHYKVGKQIRLDPRDIAHFVSGTKKA